MRFPQRYNSLRGSIASSVSPTRKRLRGWVRQITPEPKKALRRKSQQNNSDSKVASPFPSNHADSIRYFANPGPGYEDRATPDTPLTRTKAKAVAFYLPQFHTFEENDAWWGDGFTEWRNVARGTPRFQGHYQPRIPRDLGFYDLTNPATLKAQAALARSAGINAFCFYYYWFNGTRLMDKPLDLFADNDIDQEFCIMWANENWTRRWDGREQDVLIEQNYAIDDEDAFIADTAKYMSHSRYMTVNNRPLFILYRANQVPDTAETIKRWREKWTKVLGIEPLIFMVQSYSDRNPNDFGCDGALEFPPHKVSRNLTRRNREYAIFDPNYKGQVRHYQDVVDKSLNEPAPTYPLIKTVSPSWDNDARREGTGVTFQGSTPELYGQWLSGAIDFAHAHKVGDESLVFINAWNEWAEAAYLEPDVHYGHAYLNKTYKMLSRASRDARSNGSVDLLLIGHDAHANGAQMLLLSLARYFKIELGLNIRILLKSGGVLLPEYEAVAPTSLLEDIPNADLKRWFISTGCKRALFNTCVTGDLLWSAKDAQVLTLSLVHELPALINEFGLRAHVSAIAKLADHIVFPSEHVQKGFKSFQPVIENSVSIRAQGLYKKISASALDRVTERQQLGLTRPDKLVLNVGYADHRKGFDCFISAALRLCDAMPNIHFCWVGKRSKDMNRWFKTNAGKKLRGRLHLVDFTDEVAPWYAAADCLYLSSREDPFPSVALEALSLGKPVVVHDGATGFDSDLLDLMEVVPLENERLIDEAILRSFETDNDEKREIRKSLIKNQYQIEEYGLGLLDYLGIPTTNETRSDTLHNIFYREAHLAPDILL